MKVKPVLSAGPLFHSLRLQSLSLQVRLGCEALERELPQEVLVSIEFRFHESPPGFTTDKLSDTICYAQVTEAVVNVCEHKEYKLIEHLSKDIYQISQKIADHRAHIAIAVNKVKPPIEKLTGGSWYRCGDFLI